MKFLSCCIVDMVASKSLFEMREDYRRGFLAGARATNELEPEGTGFPVSWEGGNEARQKKVRQTVVAVESRTQIQRRIWNAGWLSFGGGEGSRVFETERRVRSANRQ